MIDRRELLGGIAVMAALGVSACAVETEDGGKGAVAPSDAAASSPQPTQDADPSSPYASGVHHATLVVKGLGSISLALNATAAPLTVANFASLVEGGFYDGLTFHRVIEGFMIQGGDPKGDGTGGSGTTIRGEFAANGVDNPMSHVRGTLSMARASDYDSASSQFFIMHATNTSLDGQYAAFGNVTEGMDVVDAIAQDTPVEDSNGSVAVQNQPIIESIVMVD